jgi:hypothetical protein
MLSDQPSIVDIDENVQQDDDEPETLTPTQVKEPVNPVPRTTTAWQEYYDSMGVARQKVIQRLAEQKEFTVILEPLNDPVDRDRVVKPDERKTFVRRKISTKDFFEIEQMRESMRTLKNPNRQEVTKALIELYKSLAFIYLGDKATGKTIKEEDFMRCSWPYIKAILDACNLGSVAGQIPLDEQI